MAQASLIKNNKARIQPRAFFLPHSFFCQLDTPLYLSNVLFGFQIFWKITADILDRLAHLTANHEVSPASFGLTAYIIFLQFVFCLGDSEQVGRQLC